MRLFDDVTGGAGGQLGANESEPMLVAAETLKVQDVALRAEGEASDVLIVRIETVGLREVEPPGLAGSHGQQADLGLRVGGAGARVPVVLQIGAVAVAHHGDLGDVALVDLEVRQGLAVR